MYKICKPRAQS